MKLKKKTNKRSNNKLFLLAAILLYFFYSNQDDSVGTPPPPPEKQTHRLLVFVDAHLVQDPNWEFCKQLEKRIENKIFASNIHATLSGKQVNITRELHLFSLHEKFGNQHMMNYTLDAAAIKKLNGRGYRKKKTQEFHRRFRKYIKALVTQGTDRDSHILQSILSIKNYLGNQEPGDKNTIFYFTDLMQMDQLSNFSAARFNFIIPNPDEDGIHAFNVSEIEEAEDQLKNPKSPLYENYLNHVQATFSQFPSENTEIEMVGPYEHPNSNSSSEMPIIEAFWKSFFKTSGLIQHDNYIKMIVPGAYSLEHSST